MPLTPVDEVLVKIKQQASLLVDEEEIDLGSALGRILSQSIKSAINVPPSDNSAMDGYAINSAGVSKGIKLKVSDRIPAGTTGQVLVPGTAARIFTGASIPPGADAVVMQENTAVIDDEVEIHEHPQKGQNVRLCGQDIKAGEIVLSLGRKLKPQDIGLLASIGYARVPVYQKLKVAVLSTGDELVCPSEIPPNSLKPGQIYNSNQYALIALIEQLGMAAINMEPVGDSFEATEKAFLQAAEIADCIVSSGGVSVGEEDHVKAVVDKLGQIDIWKLAIKPGKPLAYGRVGKTPFFGLPGNPVSSFVTFNIVARPYLMLCQGCPDGELTQIQVPAGFEIKGGSRREYLRVKLETDERGHISLVNFANQGSGILSSLSWADGLAEVEIGAKISKGDAVKVRLL